MPNPRFREVRDQALVAESLPGDAIYIPKSWWHQVEATSPFNVLVNYGWDEKLRARVLQLPRGG